MSMKEKWFIYPTKGSDAAKLVKVREDRMQEHAHNVREKESLKSWFSLDLECILNKEVRVVNAKEKELFMPRKTDARYVRAKD